MNRDKLVKEAQGWARKEKLSTAMMVSMATNGYILICALGDDGSVEVTHETLDVPIELPVHTFMVDIDGQALHIYAEPDWTGKVVPKVVH